MNDEKTGDKINPNWFRTRLTGLTCPRCNKTGDDELGGMMLCVKSRFLRGLIDYVPDIDEHLVLCYACALELLSAESVKALIGEVSSFVKSLGSNGKRKLP